MNMQTITMYKQSTLTYTLQQAAQETSSPFSGNSPGSKPTIYISDLQEIIPLFLVSIQEAEQ